MFVNVKRVRVQVADFGLSTHLYGTELRESLKTRAVENPTWQAPEVLGERAYGLPSDVYSFGIILWELFVQQHPFREFNFRFLFNQEQAVLDGVRPSLPPTLPLTYASLTSRCWAQRVSERPSFERVVSELRDIARELAPHVDQIGADTPSTLPRAHASSAVAPPLASTSGSALPVSGCLQQQFGSPTARTTTTTTTTTSGARRGVTALAHVSSAQLVVGGTADGALFVFNALSGERLQYLPRAHSAAGECALSIVLARSA
jgi:serine/threonine protein kinase